MPQQAPEPLQHLYPHTHMHVGLSLTQRTAYGASQPIRSKLCRNAQLSLSARKHSEDLNTQQLECAHRSIRSMSSRCPRVANVCSYEASISTTVQVSVPLSGSRPQNTSSAIGHKLLSSSWSRKHGAVATATQKTNS